MNAFFQAADNVLRQGVESISCPRSTPAFHQPDFADVRSIMKDAGYASVGRGAAPRVQARRRERRQGCYSSPLLETSAAGAHGVIINITSSPDIGLEDVGDRRRPLSPRAHIPMQTSSGVLPDENLSDEMRGTVVATGFDNKSASDLRNSINNAMGEVHSLCRLAVFGRRYWRAQPRHPMPPWLLLRLKRRPWKRKAATIVTTTSCWLILNKRK